MFNLESFTLMGAPLRRGNGIQATLALTVPNTEETPIRLHAEALAFAPFREQAAKKFRQSAAGSRLFAKRDALEQLYDAIRALDLDDPMSQPRLAQLKRQAGAIEKELPELTRAAKDELKRLAGGPHDLRNALQRQMGELLVRIQAELPTELLQELFALSLACQLASAQSELVPVIADMIGSDPEAPAAAQAGPEQRPAMGVSNMRPGIGAFAAK